MAFLDDFYNYIVKLIQHLPNLIIAGDYNICHMPIDIHNPQRNQNTSGFLLEERRVAIIIIKLRLLDTFRFF